jgi:hypothetical protein
VPVALVEYEGEQHGFRKVHAVLTTFWNEVYVGNSNYMH